MGDSFDATIRLGIVNPVWDRRDRTPEDVLDRFTTLTGWADAVHQSGLDVAVVQRFDGQARVERTGISYYFAPDDRASLAALRPDVVHFNGYTHPHELRRLRRTIGRVPLVVQDHGGFDPAGVSRMRRAWMRHGLATADALLVATPPQADRFRRSGLVPSHVAIRDVMEGSTDLRVRSRPPRSSVLSMLWVGRLNANKDPRTVLAGFSRFMKESGRDAQLTFVYASGDLETALRRDVESDSSLRGRVHLAGPIPHGDLPAVYAAADYFVLGSRREGSGYAALEAMACGVVPVLTDIPSFRWLTAEGSLGALWQVGDPASLARALDQAVRRNWSEQSRACAERFERDWSWDAIGRRAAGIYRDVSRA